MAKREHEDAHGVGTREAEVLALSDDGVAPDVISAKLGVKRSYVDWVIRAFPIETGEESRWRLAAELSNRAYVKAIGATGRSFA